MDKDELYLDYIEVTNKVSYLNRQRTILSEQILKKFKAENLNKVETDDGLVTLATRTNYQHSPKVKKQEEDLKEAKRLEINTGKLEIKETKYLRVSLR